MKLSRGALIVILIVLAILAVSIVQVIARSNGDDVSAGYCECHVDRGCTAEASELTGLFVEMNPPNLL